MLLERRRLLDAEHVRHVVAHRVHRVVRLVAVKRPVALDVGDELDGARRADGHVHRRLRAPRRPRDIAAVGADLLERVAVHVDRMAIHR